MVYVSFQTFGKPNSKCGIRNAELSVVLCFGYGYKEGYKLPAVSIDTLEGGLIVNISAFVKKFQSVFCLAGFLQRYIRLRIEVRL